MNRSQIIRRVRVKLDEVAPFDGPEVVSNPTIDSCLNEASDTLLLSAPTHIHPSPYNFSGNNAMLGDHNSVILDLPSDFLIIVSVQLSAWRRAVTKAFVEGSNVHSRQHNYYARGGPWKPVAIRRFDKTRMKHILQCYSTTNDNTGIDHAFCINRTPPEYLPLIYIEPLTLIAGFMVLDIYADERAAILRSEFETWVKQREIS